MFEKVAAMLAEQLNVDVKSIKPESRFFEDLGADSFNIMAMVMDLEHEFNLIVSDDVLTTMHTVGDIVKFLEENGK